MKAEFDKMGFDFRDIDNTATKDKEIRTRNCPIYISELLSVSDDTLTLPQIQDKEEIKNSGYLFRDVFFIATHLEELTENRTRRETAIQNLNKVSFIYSRLETEVYLQKINKQLADDLRFLSIILGVDFKYLISDFSKYLNEEDKQEIHENIKRFLIFIK